MKENNKLIDAIIDLGTGMKELRNEMKELRNEMKGMRKEQTEMRKEQTEMRKEQIKTNLLLSEHSRSIMTLAKQLEGSRSDFNKYAASNDARVNGSEKRIGKLEHAVFDNGGKGMYMAKESEVGYKKKKGKRK